MQNYATKYSIYPTNWCPDEPVSSTRQPDLASHQSGSRALSLCPNRRACHAHPPANTDHSLHAVEYPAMNNTHQPKIFE